MKIAVIGASGMVGHEILTTLAERHFPVSEIHALASGRSAGGAVSFGEKDLKIQDLSQFDFKNIDLVFSAVGGDIAAEYVPKAAKAGAIVIDNSSHFRMDPDVPLIVPEVNPHHLADYRKKNIIANPNCSTIQLVVALKPLHDLAQITRVVVSTYQSVSGAGKAAMDELFNQTRAVYMNAHPKPVEFPKQIAFNAIPQIDVFMDDHATREEWKMMVETKKILDPAVRLTANCVRIPSFIGHAEMVNVEFKNDISAKDALKAWNKAPGVTVNDLDTDMEYVTPLEIQGEDDVFVSRVREDQTVENGLSFWCVADNLRKGAALNAVQIAELLGRKSA